MIQSSRVEVFKQNPEVLSITSGALQVLLFPYHYASLSANVKDSLMNMALFGILIFQLIRIVIYIVFIIIVYKLNQIGILIIARMHQVVPVIYVLIIMNDFYGKIWKSCSTVRCTFQAAEMINSVGALYMNIMIAVSKECFKRLQEKFT
ncbi:unnamed protein product [Adineta steineri]|uniref:Uncharacterized protein n=1 Tax=Adineta steineri TaxID=433720 RepID=A0A813Y7U5_9BILA|nr:unnamed protein product [Adineta steineri]